MNVFEVTAKSPKFKDVLSQLKIAEQLRLPESNWDTIVMFACLGHVTINNLPALNDYLTQHKRFIIRQLLEFVINDTKWSIQYVNSLIRRLQKVGITWSELKIITRSTRAIINDIKNKELQELNRQVDDAEKLPIDSDETVDELERLVIQALNYKFTKKQCPTLGILLDKNKNGILCELYKYRSRATQFVIPLLLKFGVIWPELDIIQKSANTELTRNEEESDDLYESYYDYLTKNDPLGYAKKLIAKIIIDLNDNINKDDYRDDYDPYYDFNTLRELYRYNYLTIDEIKMSLENAKVSIIKYLLIKIRQRHYDNVNHWLGILMTKLHCNWPELDIIQRSIDHEKNKSRRLNESNISSEHTRETALEYINKAVAELILNINKSLNDDKSLIGPHSFCANAQYLLILNLITMDDIRQSLENARAHIIRYLLTKFKDGEYLNVERWLGALRVTFGCEWPELNTIKRSLDAEVFKLTEGTDEDYETATKNLEALIMDMKESLAWVKERPHANVFPLNNLSRIEFIVRRREIYRENILPELDSIRKEILTYMLQQIKSNSRINYEIKNHCDELKSLGCIWPELDTIIQSYNADRNRLRESANPNVSKPSLDRNINNLIRDINYNLTLDSGYMPILVPWDYITRIGILMRRGELTHEEVITAFEKFKVPLIKYLLKLVVKGDYGLVEYWLVELQDNFDCQWPELKTLKKSIGFERKKSDINEDQDYREIYMGYLSRSLNRNNPEQVGEALVKASQMYIKLLPEDIAKIKKHQELIINALSIMAGHLYLTWVFNIFTWLRINGFDDWDEELSIDYYKSHIIKGLLLYVKLGDFSNVMINISYLQDAGVHWSELYIISLSINHDRNRSNGDAL